MHRKGKIQPILRNGLAATFFVAILLIVKIWGWSADRPAAGKTATAFLSSPKVIAMRTSDVQTINIGQGWQIVRINPQSNCRLDPESGDTIQVRFGTSDRIFEKANGRWFSNSQPLDRLPGEIAVNQFEVRSRSNIQVKISVWPK